MTEEVQNLAEVDSAPVQDVTATPSTAAPSPEVAENQPDQSASKTFTQEELDAAMDKEPEVAPEPPPATTKVTKTKATRKKTYKVGDKVKFNFKNEEGEIEEITATIEEINGDDLKVNDDTYDYDIKVSDVL